MNERIKDLAIKAGIQFIPLVIDGEEYDYEDVSMDGSEDLKKFATLIIKECVNEIHAADIGSLEGKSYYLDKVAQHIEKHFGVEG